MDAATPEGSEALTSFANQFSGNIIHVIGAEGKEDFVSNVENIFHVKLIKRLVNPRDQFESYISDDSLPFGIRVNGEDGNRNYSGFFFSWRDAPDARFVRLPPTCISIREMNGKLSVAGWRLLGKSKWGGGKDGFAVPTRTSYEYIDGATLSDSKLYIFMFSTVEQEDCLDYFQLNGDPMRSPFAPVQSPAADHMRKGA
jgi:hypothetical protein